MSFSDTYNQATIKVKIAESRSDISCESAMEDKRSRHERCRILPDTEPGETNANTKLPSKIARKSRVAPPVPRGLQNAAIATISKCR
jgi:hypothetical protein